MGNKVLVVDDEKSIVHTLKLLLEMEGYDVITAENGQEAVDITSEQLPDVIIMDFKMPVMNGWEATKVIRQIPGCETIPILGNTGYASEENVIQGMENGLTEIVRKPFNIEKLLSLVKDYLNQ